jgi:hypothetical protein
MRRYFVWLMLLSTIYTPCVTAGDSLNARLLQLLRAKGMITEAEFASLGTTDGGVDSRLIRLLKTKGLLTEAEVSNLEDGLPVPANGSRNEPTVVSASQIVSSGGASALETPQEQDPLARPPDFGPGDVGPTAKAVIPAPVEVLPLARTFSPHTLTLHLGSAVTVNPYGMLKTTAAYDTNLSSGDDFPFFGRVVAAGPETANTTGTVAPAPDFRVKARSARLGVDILAPDPNEAFTITGKLEFDFEGSFPSATNRNIGALHSSEASIRLAWVRLDGRPGGIPLFLKFGQDASLFGSSTQPTGIETTGNYMWQGNVSERQPGFVGGMRIDTGAGRFRIEPEAGVFLPSAGEYVADVIPSPRWGSGLGSAFTQSNPAPGQGTTGFGQREGTNSARPRYEGRIVIEFEPWRGRNVPPSQIVGSVQYGERVRYFAPPFQEAGRNFAVRSKSDGYTGEFRLATPWWTLLGKYYRGADLRYYFGGLAQDVFFDGGDPFTATAGTPRMLPVRAQGGFIQLQLPLSVWFNPASPRLHGFSTNLMAGYDSAFARDARRAGQRKAQLSLMGNFLYQYNRYIQFAVETDFIQTSYTDPQGGVIDPASGIVTGQPGGRIGKNLRFEVGPTFTF